MNVNWNPNISSEWWKELSSVNSRTESQNANSSNVTLGSDSVQISQNAINALYRSEQEGEDNTSSQNNNSSNKLSEVLDDLVTSGTITQEQEDEIKEALSKSFQAPPPPPPQQGGLGQSPEDTLKSLESVGITKDQLNTIVDALKTSADEDNQSQTDEDQENAISNNFKSALKAYGMQLYGL